MFKQLSEIDSLQEMLTELANQEEEIKKESAAIKSQIVAWTESFKREHGRDPKNADKKKDEKINDLFERRDLLKQQLAIFPDQKATVQEMLDKLSEAEEKKAVRLKALEVLVFADLVDDDKQKSTSRPGTSMETIDEDGEEGSDAGAVNTPPQRGRLQRQISRTTSFQRALSQRVDVSPDRSDVKTPSTVDGWRKYQQSLGDDLNKAIADIASLQEFLSPFEAIESDLKTESAAIKSQIVAWTEAFRVEHGRDPKNIDKKKNEEINELFDRRDIIKKQLASMDDQLATAKEAMGKLEESVAKKRARLDALHLIVFDNIASTDESAEAQQQGEAQEEGQVSAEGSMTSAAALETQKDLEVGKKSRPPSTNKVMFHSDIFRPILQLSFCSICTLTLALKKTLYTNTNAEKTLKCHPELQYSRPAITASSVFFFSLLRISRNRSFPRSTGFIR